MNEDLGSLEHEVDQSRARFDRSLEELGRRLQPSGLADEALGLIGAERADNIRQAARSLVREHPLPLLLLGSGLGLLMWELTRRSQDQDINWYNAAGLDDSNDQDELETILAVDVTEEFP